MKKHQKNIQQLLNPERFQETNEKTRQQFYRHYKSNSQTSTPNKRYVQGLQFINNNNQNEEMERFSQQLLSVQNSNNNSVSNNRYMGTPSQYSQYSNGIKKRIIMKDRHGKNLDPFQGPNPNQQLDQQQYYYENNRSSAPVSPQNSNRSSANNFFVKKTENKYSFPQYSQISGQNNNQNTNYKAYQRLYQKPQQQQINEGHKNNNNIDGNDSNNNYLRKQYSKSQHYLQKPQTSQHQVRQSSSKLKPVNPKNPQTHRQFQQNKKLIDDILSNDGYQVEGEQPQKERNIQQENNKYLADIEQKYHQNNNINKESQKYNGIINNQNNNNNVEQQEGEVQEEDLNQINCLKQFIDEKHPYFGVTDLTDKDGVEEMIKQVMQTNPEYFDHKSGKCLCSLCSCGFCKVNCETHNQNLKNINIPLSWASSYTKEYQGKPTITKQKWDPKKAYQSYTSILPGEFNTTMKEDYKKKIKNPEFKKLTHLPEVENPFFAKTTYGQNFYDYKSNFYIPIKGSNWPTVVPNTQFTGNTSYKHDYEKNKNHKAQQEEPIKPFPLKPFPQIDIFFSDTTAKKEFNKKPASQSQKIDAPQNNYQLGADQYKGQFESDYQKNFQSHQKICQARQIIVDQYNSKRKYETEQKSLQKQYQQQQDPNQKQNNSTAKISKKLQFEEPTLVK